MPDLKEIHAIRQKFWAERMTLNELVSRAHALACSNGEWETFENGKLMPPSSFDTHLSLISQIVKATESVRNYEPSLFYMDQNPKGEAIELAEVVIRIADYFGARGWDLTEMIRIKMDCNSTRPNRHGGKF